MLRWLSTRRIIKCSQYSYSTVNPSVATLKTSNEDKSHEESKSDKKLQNKDVSSTEQSKLVAAAFASLKEIQNQLEQKHVSEFDKQIASASDINALLALVDGAFLPKHHALKVMFFQFLNIALVNYVSVKFLFLIQFEFIFR